MIYAVLHNLHDCIDDQLYRYTTHDTNMPIDHNDHEASDHDSMNATQANNKATKLGGSPSLLQSSTYLDKR